MYRYGYTRTRKHERERTPCNRRAHTPRVARTSAHKHALSVRICAGTLVHASMAHAQHGTVSR